MARKGRRAGRGRGGGSTGSPSGSSPERNINIQQGQNQTEGNLATAPTSRIPVAGSSSAATALEQQRQSPPASRIPTPTARLPQQSRSAATTSNPRTHTPLSSSPQQPTGTTATAGTSSSRPNTPLTAAIEERSSRSFSVPPLKKTQPSPVSSTTGSSLTSFVRSPIESSPAAATSKSTPPTGSSSESPVSEPSGLPTLRNLSEDVKASFSAESQDEQGLLPEPPLVENQETVTPSVSSTGPPNTPATPEMSESIVHLIPAALALGGRSSAATDAPTSQVPIATDGALTQPPSLATTAVHLPPLAIAGEPTLTSAIREALLDTSPGSATSGHGSRDAAPTQSNPGVDTKDSESTQNNPETGEDGATKGIVSSPAAQTAETITQNNPAPQTAPPATTISASSDVPAPSLETTSRRSSSNIGAHTRMFRRAYNLPDDYLSGLEEEAVVDSTRTRDELANLIMQMPRTNVSAIASTPSTSQGSSPEQPQSARWEPEPPSQIQQWREAGSTSWSTVPLSSDGLSESGGLEMNQGGETALMSGNLTPIPAPAQGRVTTGEQLQIAGQPPATSGLPQSHLTVTSGNPLASGSQAQPIQQLLDEALKTHLFGGEFGQTETSPPTRSSHAITSASRATRDESLTTGEKTVEKAQNSIDGQFEGQSTQAPPVFSGSNVGIEEESGLRVAPAGSEFGGPDTDSGDNKQPSSKAPPLPPRPGGPPVDGAGRAPSGSPSLPPSFSLPIEEYLHFPRPPLAFYKEPNTPSPLWEPGFGPVGSQTLDPGRPLNIVPIIGDQPPARFEFDEEEVDAEAWFEAEDERERAEALARGPVVTTEATIRLERQREKLIHMPRQQVCFHLIPDNEKKSMTNHNSHLAPTGANRMVQICGRE